MREVFVNCKGVKSSGAPCSAKALENGFCRWHQDQYKKNSSLEIEGDLVSDDSFIDKLVNKINDSSVMDNSPEVPLMQDRMLRYRRNMPCPACGNHPNICMMRRGNYAAFRCRSCGHRWEVGER
jgi:predicted RNA-binding Zn-ribbon protein involved in translation (DUF1610 family)